MLPSAAPGPLQYLPSFSQFPSPISETLRKAYHEKWPLITIDEKGDMAWILKFAVLSCNDWTGGQLSVIGKQHSQLRGIGKGSAPCRLPCDFPIKSGSQIYFIIVGIYLPMCSWILCCVPDFGRFLFLKLQFWGWHVCICCCFPFPYSHCETACMILWM